MKTVTGKCHCGSVSYQTKSQAEHHALCHCTDCRRWSGAPFVGWIAFRESDIEINGSTETYESSEHGRREFCRACGTGLFYRNAEMLPGIIDVQSGTLDDVKANPPGAQIMVKERLDWVTSVNELPEFTTYPSMD